MLQSMPAAGPDWIPLAAFARFARAGSVAPGPARAVALSNFLEARSWVR
jgi:hypothetical protein